MLYPSSKQSDRRLSTGQEMPQLARRAVVSPESLELLEAYRDAKQALGIAVGRRGDKDANQMEDLRVIGNHTGLIGEASSQALVVLEFPAGGTSLVVPVPKAGAYGESPSRAKRNLAAFYARIAEGQLTPRVA